MAAVRTLGTALKSSSPLFKVIYRPGVGHPHYLPLYIHSIMGRREFSTKKFVRGHWERLSHENRSMIKQSFINLAVPAVYSGCIWLVSLGADLIRKATHDDDDEMDTLSSEIGETKEELDKKLSNFSKAFEKVKEEKEKQELQIAALKGEVLEKELQIKMLRSLLKGQMGEVGVLWMDCFIKNLNLCTLSYYDPPELAGLVYWNDN